MDHREQLPSGTVTFMFTDIEGSTEILQELGDDRYRKTLADHDAIVGANVERNGHVVRTMGDAFFAVFADPVDAVEAAVGAQSQLADISWPTNGEIRIRIGLHTGIGKQRGNDYAGLDVHRASRISDAAHGGQTLISATTAGLVTGHLGSGISIRRLGEYHLKGVSAAESLFQVDAPSLRSEFPAIRTVDPVASRLPEDLSSFVGRELEVGEVVNQLGKSRLLTLTGPGGTGKTRLALRGAVAVQNRYRDGVFMVALESIREADQIPSAILEAMGLETLAATDPGERVRGYLSDKEVLLILDNYEQLLPQTSFVAEIIASAPRVQVLVTSRRPLHVTGEQEFSVPPLSLVVGARNGTSDAVELFCQRADSVEPGFRPEPEAISAIEMIVTKLDGLPLAIELAASRVKSLTPAEILDRLNNRLLVSPATDLTPRQQTIDGAIGWSYDLLDESTRRLFERCSIFSGGATLAQVDQVCGPTTELGVDVVDGMAALVDSSLVQRTAVGGQSRYQMLVVIRQFAAKALDDRGETTQIRSRHGHSYAEVARMAGPLLLSSQQNKWLDILHNEHDNLRAALDFAGESGATDLAMEIASNLWRFWQRRGHLIEAEQRLETILELPNGTPRLRAKTLEALAGVRYWRGDWTAARQPYEQALEILREGHDDGDLANALYNVSFPTGWAGDRARAVEYLNESLRLSRSIDDHLGVGRAYWGLCDQAMYERNNEEVLKYAFLAEAEFSKLDAPFDLGWARFMIAETSTVAGDFETARSYVDLAASSFVEARDLSAVVLILHLKAALLVEEGAESMAARLIGAVDTLKQQTGAGIADIEINQYEAVNRIRRDPRTEIKQEIDNGRRLDLTEVLELALSA